MYIVLVYIFTPYIFYIFSYIFLDYIFYKIYSHTCDKYWRYAKCTVFFSTQFTVYRWDTKINRIWKCVQYIEFLAKCHDIPLILASETLENIIDTCVHKPSLVKVWTANWDNHLTTCINLYQNAPSSLFLKGYLITTVLKYFITVNLIEIF